MSSKKIWIASDHAGYELKAALIRLLGDVQWQDLGPAHTGAIDYPDMAERLAMEVSREPTRLGVLICGSGIGMSIAANKVNGARAALISNSVAARLARQHNNANIICLGSRFFAAEYAAEMVRIFLETEFSDEPRHQVRVEKIHKLEQKNK